MLDTLVVLVCLLFIHFFLLIPINVYNVHYTYIQLRGNVKYIFYIFIYISIEIKDLLTGV